tara:strand:+ start:1275 stop:1742 length:468 start_codon:yes stop_codon:yes gene_type:complete
MTNNYINVYNNLIKLTRNKSLYQNTNIDENFSIRLTFFLLHFAFFLKNYQPNNPKKILQEIYDFNFRQLEISIREIGYGDVSINKKMKDYLNLFHKILIEIENWDELNNHLKGQFFIKYINENSNSAFFVNYFDNYFNNLKKNTLNSFINNILDL